MSPFSAAFRQAYKTFQSTLLHSKTRLHYVMSSSAPLAKRQKTVRVKPFNPPAALGSKWNPIIVDDEDGVRPSMIDDLPSQNGILFQGREGSPRQYIVPEGETYDDFYVEMWTLALQCPKPSPDKTCCVGHRFLAWVKAIRHEPFEDLVPAALLHGHSPLPLRSPEPVPWEHLSDGSSTDGSM